MWQYWNWKQIYHVITSPGIAVLVGLCESCFRGCFLLLNPHCSPTATFLLWHWDLILWIFLLGNSSLLPPSQAGDFQTGWCFLDSWHCECRRRALYSVQQHCQEKQEGWGQDPGGLGSTGLGWAPSTGLPAGIADSSVSQHNRIHLLAADISFCATDILPKTSLGCQSCPMKLILCNYLSTRSGTTTYLSCLPDAGLST